MEILGGYMNWGLKTFIFFMLVLVILLGLIVINIMKLGAMW